MNDEGLDRPFIVILNLHRKLIVKNKENHHRNNVQPPHKEKRTLETLSTLLKPSFGVFTSTNYSYPKHYSIKQKFCEVILINTVINQERKFAWLWHWNMNSPI